jgi:hypothetical protein
VILGILDILEALGIVRLDATLDKILECPLVLVPLVKLRTGDNFNLLRCWLGALVSRLSRAGLLLAGRLFLDIILPFATPVGRSGGCRRRGRCRLGGRAGVIVHAPHVVPQIPLAWETMSGNGALTSFVGAQIRLLAVAMHGVGLTLMAE